jgi:chromosome segregation protein
MGKISRIKMRDFKSFKSAIIPFVDGYTTVVGPNGSGKSNLLDAICFVMGTSSMKSLRAGRLTDLVHHDSRSGTAEVTIELKDSQKNKHVVSRSIDKNGDSVYRLNDKRTTKTVIQDLLSTLNIPPEGHNLIMQGDIVNFIKMSPRQRREIIDDISGIAEYNLKKEKALKELETVNEKIKEATIVLSERTGYLREIRKERDEALRYRKLQGRRESLRVSIVHRELGEVQKKYDDLEGQIKKEKTNFEKVFQKNAEISASMKNWENRLDGLNKEIIEKGEKDRLGIHKKIEQIKGELALTKDRIENTTGYMQRTETRVEGLKGEKEELEREHGNKLRALERLADEEKEFEVKVQKKQKELEDFMSDLKEKNLLLGDITRSLEEANGRLEEKRESFYKIKGELDRIRESISLKKLSMASDSGERAQRDKELRKLEQHFDGLKKKLSASKRELLKKAELVNGLAETEREIANEIEATERELRKSGEKFQSLSTKIKTIKSVAGDTVAQRLVRERSLKGIVGILGELCEYEGAYATAIETAAGSRLKFVVTQTADDATNAIRWLKKNGIGRATFIPLDCIKPPAVSEEAKKALKDKKVVDLVINLVEFKDKKLKPAFLYALGDTVVVEDIDTAHRIGFGTARMVTLDGDLAEPSGTITGGFRHHDRITVQDLKDVKSLEKEIAGMEKSIGKLKSRLEETRDDMNIAKGKRAELELKVREEEVTINEVGRRLKEMKDTSEEYESKGSSVSQEIEALKVQLVEKDKELKEIQAEINVMEQDKRNLKEKMDSPEAQEVSQEIDKKQKQLQTLKDQRAEVHIQRRAVDAEVEKVIGKKTEDIGEDIKNAKKDIEENENKLGELHARERELEKTLDDMLDEEKKVSSAMGGLLEKRESLEEELRKLAESRGEIQRQLEVAKELVNAKEIEKARLETRLGDLKREVEEVTPENIIKDLPVGDMRKEIEETTRKMASLEPINLKAIDLYDKYQEDVKEIKEKSDRLVKEREAVLAMMGEIEKRRVEVFMEAYNVIKENFMKTFKEFYPESEEAYADLKLEKEENPFEGGLVLEAKPSGKPLKHIDAMSGGEKALTAIAFLFAIQGFSPSPFYILDEADAALDLNNSNRVVDMIKERGKSSQFIVITHNKALLHKSDQIVGVAMDKEKKSSVVQVDLKRYESNTAVAAEKSTTA